MNTLLAIMTGISFTLTVAGSIIFTELMRRSGNGSIWKGLKRFFNGY